MDNQGRLASMLVATLSAPVVVEHIVLKPDRSWMEDGSAFEQVFAGVSGQAWDIGVAIMKIRELSQVRDLPLIEPNEFRTMLAVAIDAYMEIEEREEWEGTIQ